MAAHKFRKDSITPISAFRNLPGGYGWGLRLPVHFRLEPPYSVRRYRPNAWVASMEQTRARPASKARQTIISRGARPSKPSRAAVTAQLTGLKRETPRIHSGIRLRDMIMLDRKVIGRTTKFITAMTSSCRRASSARAFENEAKAAPRSEQENSTTRTPAMPP
jgi:hypothetical protein